jgi:hypothetical protein
VFIQVLAESRFVFDSTEEEEGRSLPSNFPREKGRLSPASTRLKK